MGTYVCGHAAAAPVYTICPHLFPIGEHNLYRYFTGQGQHYALLCHACKTQVDTLGDTLLDVCAECFQKIEELGYWDGIVGMPEIKEAPAALSFTHRILASPDLLEDPLIDIQPLVSDSRNDWMGLTQGGTLVRLNFDKGGTVERLGTVPSSANQPFTSLLLSPSGELAVVYATLGTHGVVVEVNGAIPRMTLQRDGYHSDVSPFPVAFFEYAGRLLLIHSPAWNRLDIFDPWTGDILTERGPTSYRDGEPRPAHYLDYFHGHLTVSPRQNRIADNGWIWQPSGSVTTWSLTRWLEENVWESEDGDSVKSLCWREYFWQEPVCWIDNATLVIWGYGNDDEWLIPAARVFDVRSGAELRWFAGPDVSAHPNPDKTQWKQQLAPNRDPFIFDSYLFAISEPNGIGVWDIETGERLLHDPSFSPIRYHRGTKEFLSCLPDGTFQLSQLREQRI